MSVEFNLSKKIINLKFADIDGILDIEDVKEFIRLLKEEINIFETDNHLRIEGKSIRSLVKLKNDIDKLAGKELS